jgi:2-C-methyl-D-erythritol 4-phosphate cytidylyltransferase
LRYWLVIPAAGIGQRLGATLPKQYLEVAGRSLLEWSMSTFARDERCQGLVVALAPGDRWWPAVRARLPRTVIEVAGGAERGDSVRLALEDLAGRVDDDPWVLVHDAARPCVTREEVDALLEGVVSHPDGGVLALPLADTLKRQAPGEGASLVGHTEPRGGLWRALTPQVFRLGRLLGALRRAAAEGRVPTDEAQAIEWAGLGRPLLVAGAAGNVKVTTPADLELVSTILAARVAAGAAGKTRGATTGPDTGRASA